MSNQRDTQFQGFAGKVVDELMGVDVWIDTVNNQWRSEWETIIAQRAYDLVEHTLKEVHEYITVNDIPDLTVLPEVNHEQ